jgi:putative component of toxin-antitoxin plasmid stabilization module
VDTAKQKLADYRADGGTDVNREIALIQGVQSAVMARYQAELALIQQAVQAEVQAIQTRMQADIDATNTALNAAIQAENDRLAAITEAESKRLEAETTAIQDAADVAAEIRQEAQQAALDALNEQLQTANQLKSAIKGIADYAKSLMTAADSPLSPEARLSAAQKQYEETLAKAKAGDAEAAARYQQDAEAYRNAAKDYYASSAGYGDVYSKIQSDATALGNTNVTSPDSVESQIKELRKQQAEENKQAQKAVQDQIKAAQQASQDYLAGQRQTSEVIVSGLRATAESQILAIRTKADEQIKAAQDLDSRPDVRLLKADVIKDLEALDKDLAAAYDAAAKQYQTFLDSLAGVVGANTTVIGSLVEWLRSQGVNVTAPQNPDPGVYAPTSSTASGAGDPRPHYAAGGHYRGGVALVGELGPELINFNRPGYVHTAEETARILASVSGSGPAIRGSGSAANTADQIRQLLGGLPFDPRQLLSMFSAANDAHGSYANILDLPPTWSNAAAAVQSLMLKPASEAPTIDMPFVGYQPPARSAASLQTAQIEERLSRIEAGNTGDDLKGLKEALESIRRESSAGVKVQSAGFSQLLAVMNQMLARLEDMERRSRYAA